MKVKIGDKVWGECGGGKVVGMTKEWCIYEDSGHENAEPWDQIVLQAEPGEPQSPLAEKDLDK